MFANKVNDNQSEIMIKKAILVLLLVLFTGSLNAETNPPPTQVSEPGALALMGLGLGLVLYRRKRRV